MSDQDDTAEVEQIRQDWNRRCDPDPREVYESDAEFRALVERVAAQCRVSACAVLDDLSGKRAPQASTEAADTDIAEMVRRLRLEVTVSQPAGLLAAPVHRHGTRRPGHKTTPPVPRWARKRK